MASARAESRQDSRVVIFLSVSQVLLLLALLTPRLQALKASEEVV